MPYVKSLATTDDVLGSPQSKGLDGVGGRNKDPLLLCVSCSSDAVVAGADAASADDDDEEERVTRPERAAARPPKPGRTKRDTQKEEGKSTFCALAHKAPVLFVRRSTQRARAPRTGQAGRRRRRRRASSLPRATRSGKESPLDPALHSGGDTNEFISAGGKTGVGIFSRRRP